MFNNIFIPHYTDRKYLNQWQTEWFEFLFIKWLSLEYRNIVLNPQGYDNMITIESYNLFTSQYTLTSNNIDGIYVRAFMQPKLDRW